MASPTMDSSARPTATEFLEAVLAALPRLRTDPDPEVMRMVWQAERILEAIVAARNARDEDYPDGMKSSVHALAEGIHGRWVKRGRPDPSHLEVLAAQFTDHRWWGAVGR